MMRSALKPATLIVRTPQAVKSHIAAQALITGKSITATVLELVGKHMEENPIYAVVHHVITDQESFYAVALGESADDFHTSADEEAAMKAARNKLTELGFPWAKMELREEDLRATKETA